MKENFFRSMTWLHTWVGLLVCWLLYLIFFAGTLSFFRDEITLWAQPEVHHVQANPARVSAQKQQIISAVAQLQQQAPDSPSWRISLPEARIPVLSYGYAKPREEGQRRAQFEMTHINPNEGELVEQPRDTRGGNFFYRLHFDLHYIDVLTARWIVCLASLFMLIALISGVIIHKRIFKDMFSFRRGKGSRSWLDGHNVSSVLALPFHLMITYTGLITLIFMLFPYPAKTLYEDGLRGLFNDALPTNVRTEPSSQAAPFIDIKVLLDQIYTNYPEADFSRVFIRGANTESATLAFYLATGKQVQDNGPVLLYNGVDGSLLAQSGTELSAAKVFYDSMTALHTGRLADPLLRWLYFICGIAGCAMIATGCIMWARRLRERMKAQHTASLGLKLVEALNLATLMGLTLATCAFFIANRLLPLDIAGRADKEILAFFLAWLAVTLLALFKRGKKQWWQCAWLNAFACLSVPVVNAFSTNGNVVSYALQQQWSLLACDLLFIVAALACIAQATKIRTAMNPAQQAKATQNQRKRTLKEQQA
ncbi:PepSY-associated TM helix domain-containing protein [Pseudoalteromonas mariniglutinosa]|uniref:PepSY-associated TM helix domain-containing protein n=1 Tax=Pseudoalteromonas mariniglutinosa TaxID=206042 RepID=UPI00384D40B7